jgi:hypothetical protein
MSLINQEAQDEEKRNFIRTSFVATAHLVQGEFSTEAEIMDVSIKGLLIKTSEEIPSAIDPLEITVNLAGANSQVTLYFIAEIVRKTETGYGIHMKNIDFDSFVLLRNLIGYISQEEKSKLFTEYLNTIESYKGESVQGE